MFARLESRDFFDPDMNTCLLRVIKAPYKKYLISAADVPKKYSFVLLRATILWAPNTIKGILHVNDIVCEED